MFDVGMLVDGRSFDDSSVRKVGSLELLEEGYVVLMSLHSGGGEQEKRSFSGSSPLRKAFLMSR